MRARIALLLLLAGCQHAPRRVCVEANYSSLVPCLRAALKVEVER